MHYQPLVKLNKSLQSSGVGPTRLNESGISLHRSVRAVGLYPDGAGWPIEILGSSEFSMLDSEQIKQFSYNDFGSR
jgi:hypothetical protein